MNGTRYVLKIKNGKVYVSKMDYETLKEIVYALISLIPIGHVTTYREIAHILRISPRIVGKILSENKYPIAIPCHRVIRSDGRIGGYTINNKKNSYFKYKLLRLETFGEPPSKYNLHRILGL